MDEPKISKFFVKTSRDDQNSVHGKEKRTGSERSCVKKDVHVKGLDVQADRLTDGRESEVWDIELDKSLPSDDKSLSNHLQEAQNRILKSHVDNLAVKGPFPCLKLNDKKQLSSSGQSLQENFSPIHGQSSELRNYRSSSLASSHYTSRLFNPPHYGCDVESITHQSETKQTENEYPVSQAAPTFRFRPMGNTNHMITSPATQPPLVSPYDNIDEQGSVQAIPDMVLLDTAAVDDEPDSTETWNIGINNLYYPDQNPHNMMDVYLDDFALNDNVKCYWSQDENNQDVGLPHEHYEMHATTTDLIYQHELEPFEDDWEDRDGLDTMLYEEPDCPGSISTEEWSAIPMDNDGRDLRVYAHASHSAEEWSELDDPTAVSLSESPVYTQAQTAFVQGRSLLFGIEEPIVPSDGEMLWGIESAKHEVTARLLKDHWLPQKL